MAVDAEELDRGEVGQQQVGLAAGAVAGLRAAAGAGALRVLRQGGGPRSGELTVRPELVVEVAFDGVQSSPRYPAGVALRFARVLRHRPDKRAADSDTVADVLALLPGGGR